jgi:hypothetical protein
VKDNSTDVVALSKNRMTAFVAAYSVFKTKIGMSQEQAPVSTKIQWAIHDRAKFKDLIEDLKGFIDGLKDITDTPESSKRQLQMEQEDVESIRGDVASLRLLMEACADDHLEISEAASVCLELPYKGPEERMNIHDWMETVTPSVLLKHPQSFQSPSRDSDQNHYDRREEQPPGTSTFIVCKDHNFGDETSCLRRHDIEAIAQGGYGSLFGSRSLGNNLAKGINDGNLQGSSARLPGRQHKLYIYCSPSRPLLELALSICGNTAPFRVVIRVDDRLCTESHSHLTALQSILTLDEAQDKDNYGIHPMRAFEHSWMTAHFDMPWAQQRSQILENEQLKLHEDFEEISESSHWADGSGFSLLTTSFTDSGIDLGPQADNEDEARLSKALNRLAEIIYRLNGPSFRSNWRETWPDIIQEAEQAVSHLMVGEDAQGQVQHFLTSQTVPKWLGSFPRIKSDPAIATTTYCYILKNLHTSHGVRETLKAIMDTSDVLERCVVLLRGFSKELTHECSEVYISVVEVLQAILHGRVHGDLESTSVFTDYERQLSSAVAMVSRAAARLERRAARANIRPEPEPRDFSEKQETAQSTDEDSNFGIHTYLNLHKSDSTCAAIVTLASPSCCAELISQKPLVTPTIIPKDRHIFRLVKDRNIGSEDQQTTFRPTLYGKIKLNAAKLDGSPVE